jgi:hypothetical protein
MPKNVVEAWLAERNGLLKEHGIVPTLQDWRSATDHLPSAIRSRIFNLLTERWESHLNACHGSCVLRRPELARIVADSLAHFDGDRYTLLDYVVMPNHVHLLTAFPDEGAMLSQCDSWKPSR